MRLSRRRFTALLIPSAVSLLSAPFLAKTGLGPAAKRSALELLAPKLDPTSQVGLLGEREMDALLALVEVLIPPSDAPAAELGLMREHINRRTQTQAGYYAEYRDAARLLEEHAAGSRSGKGSFAELDLAARDRILRDALSVYQVKWAPVRYLLLPYRPVFRLKELVMPDIIRAFYNSLGGWGVVGYRCHYPGRGIDYFDYTGPLDRSCRPSSGGSVG